MAVKQGGSGVLVAAALAASVLCLAGPACAGDNLALHRPYLCSDTPPAWLDGPDRPGVTDSDDAPGCFATGGSGQFPKTVVVDLGAVCTIAKINLSNSKQGNTKHVSLALSPDAKSFEELREYYFPQSGVQTLAHSFTARQARYVKVTLYDSWASGGQGPNCLFLRELQVYGDLPSTGLSTGGDAREELRLARLAAATGEQRRRVGRSSAATGRTAQGTLRIGVLGDSGAGVTEADSKPWPDALAKLVEDSGTHVELLNLAAANQKPEDGLSLLGVLQGEQPVDLVIIAYGRDAALAGGRPRPSGPRGRRWWTR